MKQLKSLLHKFGTALVRKKSFSTEVSTDQLRRCLRLFDVTALSLGAMLGVGIYVTTGTVIHNTSGPSVIISYLLAGIASGLSAVCYAELCARIPATGSAYQFTYFTLGEIWGFLVGWNVAFEHAVGAASGGRALAEVIDEFSNHTIRNYMEKHVPLPGGILASYPDFIGTAFMILCVGLVASGIKSSSTGNIVLGSINIFVILFIICAGLHYADIRNWTEVKGGFFPYGFSGVLSGTAVLIFSYVGYEVVASTTEESINPGRDVPLALLISLSIITVLYVLTSIAITLMVPWNKISVTAPFTNAFQQKGLNWAVYIVFIGLATSVFTSTIAIFIVVPRYLFAMARDGLLWPIFHKVNERTKVPVFGTIVCGSLVILLDIFFSVSQLVEFLAIGQLFACTFVSICVIRLRYEPYENQRLSNFEEENLLLEGLKNDHEAGLVKESILISKFGSYFKWTQKYRPGQVVFYSLIVAIAFISGEMFLLTYGSRYSETWWFIIISIILVTCTLLSLCFILTFEQNTQGSGFKVPFVPFIPFLSIVINLWLMLNLHVMTWVRFGIWNVLGLLIYFLYSFSHSKHSSAVISN
uniref:cationic amino acid transporter 4-like n=1 Tax=Ciona intestinalis TaxID=7719 RepID=UPI000EF452AB|nr:cationic amino acid transporter 4-like [Ciona intestinalis]|eukprot:XP_026693323.1 cationic amino acid transporter 4-like [Ciona intestinalis]